VTFQFAGNCNRIPQSTAHGNKTIKMTKLNMMLTESRMLRTYESNKDKRRETGENCIARSLMTCTRHQLLRGY